jgi:threonine dehydratase
VGELDSIFVSVGGGGLISGIASYVKLKNPHCKIIGVQAENVSNMARSFHQGHIVKDLIIGPTIADGIAVKKPSPAILEDYLLRLVDDVVTVSEDEMAEAMVYILERCKNVVEACSAAALAAIFKGHSMMGKRTCAVMSGGNVDLNVISKVIDLGLTQRGRVVKLEVLIADRPGSLSAITKCIAEQKANVLEVHHNRHESGLHLNETHIEFVLETFSHEHIESIKNEIRKIGARVL